MTDKNWQKNSGRNTWEMAEKEHNIQKLATKRDIELKGIYSILFIYIHLCPVFRIPLSENV